MDYKFQKFTISLQAGGKHNIGVSRASIGLSTILPPLHNRTVLDIGCGVGYMTVGALRLGAKKVVSVDTENVETLLRSNLRLNRFPQGRVQFVHGDLFSGFHRRKAPFDVIIANLPQHALPATQAAKKLTGKYGGYDGTDIVCRALTEGAQYLKRRGKYYGSISELTNYRRTLRIAKTLYTIRVRDTAWKELKHEEMEPVSERELLLHLRCLKNQKIIRYCGTGSKSPIQYRVYRCEFIRK